MLKLFAKVDTNSTPFLDGKPAVKLSVAGDPAVVVGGNFSTNGGVLLLHALLAGQGAAIGPDLMFEERVSTKAVEVIFDNRETNAEGLYGVKDRQVSRAVININACVQRSPVGPCFQGETRSHSYRFLTQIMELCR